MTQAALFEVPPCPPDDPNVRYTLPSTLAWCKERAGVMEFDLDVAACAEAHCAEQYYTVEQNGLALPWVGRVWCNPPWEHLRPWVEKAWAELQASRCSVIAMLMPGNRTEQPWWQELVEPHRDRQERRWKLRTHFLPGRTSFGKPGDRLGEHAGSPPFTCVLLVWGGSG